jgi:hypothetical protein
MSSRFLAQYACVSRGCGSPHQVCSWCHPPVICDPCGAIINKVLRSFRRRGDDSDEEQKVKQPAEELGSVLMTVTCGGTREVNEKEAIDEEQKAQAEQQGEKYCYSIRITNCGKNHGK